MSEGGTLNLSDFEFRRARKSDYDGVMAISNGIFGGRDIIPAVYFDYLADPNRMFYVAVNKLTGKVAAFAGVRIIDNGETFEGEGARTDPKIRGSNLHLFVELRKKLFEDEIFHTKLREAKTVRAVMINVEALRKTYPHFPFGMRNVRDIVWKMPKWEYLQHVSRVQGDVNRSGLQHHRVVKAFPTDFEFIFKHYVSQKHLFPNLVIVRDSQTFKVGPGYTSNIPFLLGDRLSATYITRSLESEQGYVTSISFGTGIESDVPLKLMRYTIDYYGDPNVDIIKCHVFKHLQEIAKCVIASPTAEAVCSHIFIPNHVTDIINANDVIKYVSHDLGFGVMECEHTEQAFAEKLLTESKAIPHSKM